MAHFGLRGNLALVLSAVPVLDILDLEGPSVCLVDEERLEPVISYECVPVHCQDMSVPSSDPRHLQMRSNL